MTELKINICCASLNFTELDDNSIGALRSAAIPNSHEAIARLREKIHFPVEQVAVIAKCNAIMVVVAYTWNASRDVVHNRILEAWEACSNGGITEFLKQVKLFDGEAAIKYLGECAVGINSVVVGDSQVYSQIRDALSAAAEAQNNSPVFGVIANWLHEVHIEVERDTDFNFGSISLERVACERIETAIGKNGKVALLGLGRTGKLITKILGGDKKLNLVVTNRTESVAQLFSNKYGINTVPWGDFSFLENSKCIVLALDASPETTEYANKLLNEIRNDGFSKKLLIDLASPPLVARAGLPANLDLINIMDLSKAKNEVAQKRRQDVEKVKVIVDRLVPDAVDELNLRISKIKTVMQKKEGITKLSKDKLAVMKSRDMALKAVRSTLQKLDFVEIQTPYIVGIATDPPKVDKGTAFRVDWPSGDAYLRQSPQLYKQIVVTSGQPRVFEIGPFWRAEEYSTVRHLEETIGLDIEMSGITELSELYKILYAMILEVSKVLKRKDLGRKGAISLPDFSKVPVLEYDQAIDRLRAKGFKISYGDDLGILGEAYLGELIKKDTGSDFFIIQHFPNTVKKFYTKEVDNGLTETFDAILSGWELVSGALRETRNDNMKRRMKMSNIDPAHYDFYLTLMKDAPPHGGFGMGFDRLVAMVLGLDDVRNAVLFPRSFERLIP